MTQHNQKTQLPIIIMTTLYNAERYIKKCIDSIKMQKEEFICFITDDLSTDNSRNIAKAEIQNDHRFILVQNKRKMYQPGNYFQIAHQPSLHPNSIVVTLDGDDWFPDPDTLTRVKSYYLNNNILMAFGQFNIFDGSSYELGFTGKPKDLLNIRKCPWSTSHLRTFKLGLFRHIEQSDLIAPSGNYWECTGDMAIIFPMVEMCDPKYIHFTNDINMIYNAENPINDHKVNVERQRLYDHMIRSKPRYQMLFR